MTRRDPFQPVDDAARTLARNLTDAASFAALAVTQNGRPLVTRIAFATTSSGVPMSLISELSNHTSALIADPNCSLLVGEPEDKGDPLTHPRLTLQAKASFISRDSAKHMKLRARYLEQRPKSQLYIDFTDFHLVAFDVQNALLNGGFGRAYKLTPEDLQPAARR